MVTFSTCPARSTQGFFSDLYCENLISIKLTKVYACPPKAGPRLEFLYLSTLILQEFLSYSLGFLPWYFFLWRFLLCFCICLSVSNLGSRNCSVTSILRDLRRVVDFQFSAFFLVVRTRMWLPTSLHISPETRTFLFNFYDFCNVIMFKELYLPNIFKVKLKNFQVFPFCFLLNFYFN